MGIRCLQRFVREDKIPVCFHLYDTVLVIDGLNLEFQLYEASLKNSNTTAYGGDYAHFTSYIETFFKCLQSCAIKPVIIMDGSIKAEKLSTLKTRYDRILSGAQRVYQESTQNPGNITDSRTNDCSIISLLNSKLFVQVAKRLGIPVFKSIFEADDILPLIAADLGAPLVSGDSDFFLENIPAGLINPSSLLSPNLKVKTDSASGQKFIMCQIYKLEYLQRKFPGLTPELASIGGAILGNDYLPVDTELIKQLAGLRDSSRWLNRKQEIETVLRWLSGQPSVPVVLEALQNLPDKPSHQLIQYIENILQNPSQQTTVSLPSLSIENYFTANRSTLFSREAAVPQWVHDRYVDERLNYRALTIFLKQIDILYPLIEDYSLEKSTYHAVFELCDAIYGLLRSDDTNPKPVSRFVRSGERRVKEHVMPLIQIANKRLPLLSEIATLSQMERITLFYEILDLPPSLYAEMAALFPLDRPLIGSELLTLLLSLIYLCRHYPEDIWLEFFYALYVNLLLMGHYSASLKPPTLLELNQVEHVKLVKALNGFNSISVESQPYRAQVVHQYNAFQNCLENIIFLAEILDLGKVFHADHLVGGLQGTFIYNITIHLATRGDPLSCLEDLLGGRNFKYIGLFKALLNVLLEHSGRRLMGTDPCLTAAGGAVIPVAFVSRDGNSQFVRGLKKKVGPAGPYCPMW